MSAGRRGFKKSPEVGILLTGTVSYKNHLHKGKDAYHHRKFSMDATSSRPGEGSEEPLFYSPRIVSAEETMRLLEEQRRPREHSSVGEVVVSCHGNCMRCFFPVCGIHDTPT